MHIDWKTRGYTPLNDRLTCDGIEPKCRVSIIDLRTGERKHTLKINGLASEVYDVCVLDEAKRPFVTHVDSVDMETMFRPSHLHVLLILVQVSAVAVERLSLVINRI